MLSQMTLFSLVFFLFLPCTHTLSPRHYTGNLHDEIFLYNDYMPHMDSHEAQKDRHNYLGNFVPFLFKNILKRTSTDVQDPVCRRICNSCQILLSRSHSALCSTQCRRGEGVAILSCLTLLLQTKNELDQELMDLIYERHH